jgi:hypothetical protein
MICNRIRHTQFSIVSIAATGSRGARRLGKRPMAALLERECLKCGKSFPSTGPGNRFCGPCNYENRHVDNDPTKTVHGIAKDYDNPSFRYSDLL